MFRYRFLGRSPTYCAVFIFFVTAVIVAPALSYGGIASVWAVDEGEKIRRDDINNSLESGTSNTVWDGSSIRLFGGRNEVIGFQVIIEADAAGLTNVNVQVSSLTSSQGTIGNDFSLPGADESDIYNSVGRRIQLFREHYLHVARPSQALYIANPANLLGPGWWPDPLIPFEAGREQGGAPFDIPAGMNQGVWIDIYVPASTSAGTYTGNVSILADGATLQAIPLSLTIHNFTLPNRTHLRTFLLYDPQQIRKRHGTEYVLSDSYYTAEKRYYKMAQRHRLNLSAGHFPYFMDANQLSYLDGSLYSDSNGYEGPGMGIGSRVWIFDDDSVDYAWDEEPTRFYASLDDWYAYFNTHNLDWDIILYYLMDEPSETEEWQVEFIQRVADWVHGYAHPVWTMITEYINPAFIRGSDPEWITFWLPPASEQAEGYNIAAAEAQRAMGNRVGAYNGHRPGAGTPLIDDDAVAPRTWPWICFKHDIDLWYYWDVMYWEKKQGPQAGTDTDVWSDPVTFDMYEWDPENLGNGDGTLFYPGEDRVFPASDHGLEGPVSSIRMKNWRRGMQDFEYLFMARAMGLGSDADAIVAERIPQVLSDAAGLAQKSYSSRGADWEESRQRLARLIEAGPSAPGVLIETDQHSYSPTGALKLNITTYAGTGVNNADVYIVLLHPDGRSTNFGAMDTNIVPLVTSWSVMDLTELEALRLDASTLPAGAYRWYAVLVRAGADIYNPANWFSVSGAEFVVRPGA